MPRGIYKRTEITKQKISQSRLGKPRSKETRQKISIALKGVKHSEETKRKLSLTMKGRKQTKEHIRKRAKIAKKLGFGKWNKGIKRSEEFKIKVSKGMKGKNSEKNHYNWKGGITRDRHNNNNMCKFWTLKIFKRDNFTCMNCNKVGDRLNAHHIKSWAKYPKLRFNIDNGITLCVECHKKLHSLEKLEKC